VFLFLKDTTKKSKLTETGKLFQLRKNEEREKQF